jgi:hypothetical protein
VGGRRGAEPVRGDRPDRQGRQLRLAAARLNGSGPRPDLIDPIWEYYHDVGRSITGGTVYRGPRLPELAGHYVYADYISGKIWALRYDAGQKRVVANRPVRDRNLPIMSFGEDERGEVYLLTYSPAGRGVYWFVRTGGKR